MNFVNLDLREKYIREIIMPIEGLEEVWIGPFDYETPKLDTFLIEVKDRKMVDFL